MQQLDERLKGQYASLSPQEQRVADFIFDHFDDLISYNSAELAQLNQEIEAQEKEKAELTSELNRYRDEDYIKEQARTRLGLIEPGESAYRIISPKIHADELGTESEEGSNGESEGNRDWYAQLWDSISTPEEELKEDDPATEDHKLPTVPEENPKQEQPAVPEQAPAPAPAN